LLIKANPKSEAKATKQINNQKRSESNKANQQPKAKRKQQSKDVKPERVYGTHLRTK
jgi:hypothetical protein